MGLVILLFSGLLVGTGISVAVFGRTAPARTFSQVKRFFSRISVEDQRERVTAIAVWTESLRDAISASSGIEQAIAATAQFPPAEIDVQVQRLVASLRYSTLEESLREFADDLANPTSDFVVASLLIASRHQTRDFAALLTHLSECARAECDLYLRVWVSRARARTAVRIINYSVAGFCLGLLILNPAYVAPFLTAQGGFFLALTATCFAFALAWLRQITTLKVPERFLNTAGGHA